MAAATARRSHWGNCIVRKMWIAAAALSALWSQTALAATLAWRVTEVAGTVQVKSGERVRPAVKGQSLAAGDLLTTGAQGRAVLARGREFVIVSPATQLRVPAAETSRGIMQMIQDYGRAMFSIEKKTTPHFGVDTPYLAAVVKGTTFTVTVRKDGASVKVTEGVVEVATPDRAVTRMTPAGQSVAVLASNPGQLVAGDLPTEAAAAAQENRFKGKEGEGREKGLATAAENRVEAGKRAADAADRGNRPADAGRDAKSSRDAVSSSRATASAARADASAARQTARAARETAKNAAQSARDVREVIKGARPPKGS
jgi:hypothetical protein